MSTIDALIAQLKAAKKVLGGDALVLTSGYEGGLTPLTPVAIEQVQKCDWMADSTLFGDYDELDSDNTNPIIYAAISRRFE